MSGTRRTSPGLGRGRSGDGLSHSLAYMQTQPPSHPLGERLLDRYCPQNLPVPGGLGKSGLRGVRKAVEWLHVMGRAAL